MLEASSKHKRKYMRAYEELNYHLSLTDPCMVSTVLDGSSDGVFVRLTPLLSDRYIISYDGVYDLELSSNWHALSVWRG